MRVLDVQITDFGRVVALAPITRAGREWLETEVGDLGVWLAGACHLDPDNAERVRECLEADGYGVTQ